MVAVSLLQECVGPGEHEAAVVQRHLVAEPLSVGFRSDEDEQGADCQRRPLMRAGVLHHYCFELRLGDVFRHPHDAGKRTPKMLIAHPNTFRHHTTRPSRLGPPRPSRLGHDCLRRVNALDRSTTRSRERTSQSTATFEDRPHMLRKNGCLGVIEISRRGQQGDGATAGKDDQIRHCRRGFLLAQFPR